MKPTVGAIYPPEKTGLRVFVKERDGEFQLYEFNGLLVKEKSLI